MLSLTVVSDLEQPKVIICKLWGRNLWTRLQLLPAGGNAGHYAGVLGDQRTYGITLKYSL
jgi:hypothetical protein